MPERIEWVLLAYRVPREPSAPRIAIWRRLRKLGVAQVVDGLAGLPADSRSREQLEWVADEVTEAGGEASVWLARLSSAAQERRLVSQMQAAIAADYQAVVDEAARFLAEPQPDARRVVARLRRQLRRINSRDYFSPPQRESARLAVAEMAVAGEAAVT